MLIYAKNVKDENTGKISRVLYYSTTGIPADADSAVTYKDADGDTLTIEEKDVYLDGSANGKQRIVRVSDGKVLNVFCGDKQIIGDDVVAKVLKNIEVDAKKVKKEYNVGDALDLTGLVVKAIYESGEKEAVTTYTTSPADKATLAATDTKVTVSYTESEVTKTAEFAITVKATPVENAEE